MHISYLVTGSPAAIVFYYHMQRGFGKFNLS